MTSGDSAKAYIRALQPYRPGMSIEELARQYKLDPHAILKLASNENPAGMGQLARDAIGAALESTNRYPDGHDLTHALAEYHGLGAKNIILGNGSNDVLDLIARVYLDEGDEAISSEYGFLVYQLATTMTGATNVVVPANDFGHDLEGFAGAITDNTRVIWIANPNNPTGTFIDYSQIEAFLKRVPSDVIVVLDEAYYEYLAPEDSVDTTKWLQVFPNLVLTRTFSKIHGLAGLRVGYGMASSGVVDLLNRVRQPFNVNGVGLAAATAALKDGKFIGASAKQNSSGMQTLLRAFDDLGVSYIPSYGNFITFKSDNASSLHQKLLSRGVIVRPLDNYGLSDYLRVTIGSPTENEKFITTLQDLLSV